MNIQPGQSRSTTPASKQKNYNDIVAFLDAHWNRGKKETTLERMTAIDKACGSVAKKLPAIMVSGTNGKSLTLHFATKLLQAEGLAVGTFYSPHILTYNERITINHEYISNKSFTEIGNTVITAAEELGLEFSSYEILTMMCLLYCHEQKVDVILLEAREGGSHDAINICDAKVAAITRATAPNTKISAEQLKDSIHELVGVVKPGTHVVAGDQVKAHLQIMEELTLAQGGVWAMPIRKLASLPYPFEQLHGRCAALAERIAHIYINTWTAKDALIVSDSLLVKQQGRRGRPTIEAKKLAQLNPKKTIEQFWKDAINTLPGRFQVLDKEKYTVLLDSADNLDAFENLLLGIRLLHYQRPIKGLTLILGAEESTLHGDDFLKMLRYFFKKTSGQVIICPASHEPVAGTEEHRSWIPENVANDIKSRKMKASAAASFEEAFEVAKPTVDERHGLIVIAGSTSIISDYWRLKGIKKLG